MLIWYDPTEAREGTRLPSNIITAGSCLAGLEAETGADLLLSPLSGPPLTELNRPGRLALQVHCQAGVLIQRKSGMDLVSSIKKLSSIQWRMQRWGLAWLLVTGNIGCGKDGLAYVDGRRSHVSYQGLIGAFDYWQLRGGGVSVLRSDSLSGKWFQLMCERVQKVHEEPQVEIEMLKQVIVPSQGSAQEKAAIQTLSTLPGIGEKGARSITTTYGSLSASLCALTGEEKIKGVGVKTRGEVRKWLGLKKGERLEVKND